MLLNIEIRLREAITSIVFDRLTEKKDVDIDGLTHDEVGLLIQSTCADDVAQNGSIHSTDYLEDCNMPVLNYQLTSQSITLLQYNCVVNAATSRYYHNYVLQAFEDFMEFDYVAPLSEDLQ